MDGLDKLVVVKRVINTLRNREGVDDLKVARLDL